MLPIFRESLPRTVVRLGHRFLKHIERTGVLLYLIDMAGTDGRDPYEDYCSLKQELALYRAEMQEKPAVIAANKMDLPEAAANLKNFQSRVGDVPLFSLSAVTGAGVKALLEELYKHVQKRVALLPEESYDQGEVIFLPPAQTRELKITVEGEVYLVEGDEVEKLFSGPILIVRKVCAASGGHEKAGCGA